MLSYRSMRQRDRYPEHCRQHLHVLDLLVKERNDEASEFMKEQLQYTLSSISKIGDILKP